MSEYEAGWGTAPQPIVSPVDARRLMLGLVDLLAQTEAVTDISPAVIRAHLGVEMAPRADDGWAYWARLTPQWTYVVEHEVKTISGSRFGLEFLADGAAWQPMAEIAAIDLSDFSARLQKAGYRYSLHRGGYGRVLWHAFDRGQMRVAVDVRPEVYHPDAEVRWCVQSVVAR